MLELNEEMKAKENEMINDSLQIKEAKDSYLKKENLIKLLNYLSFTEVKDVTITCITGYQLKVSDKGNKYVEPLGYNIHID